MAFKNFSEYLYIKTYDNAENARFGSFQTQDNMELGHIRTVAYIRGTLSGTEKMRLKVYSDVGYRNLMFVSDWSNFSDIEIQKDFLFYLRFDFDRQNINKNNRYHVTGEIADYTRNGNDFYFGIAHDFPHPVYDNSEDLFYNHPLVMQIFGYF